MITLYHGTRKSDLPRHAGLCLAETAIVARDYAGEDGDVYEVLVDDDMLSWEHLTGDAARAAADASGGVCGEREAADLAARYGVSSLWYEDFSGQRAHDTLRLLTEDALAAIVSARKL